MGLGLDQVEDLGVIAIDHPLRVLGEQRGHSRLHFGAIQLHPTVLPMDSVQLNMRNIKGLSASFGQGGFSRPGGSDDLNFWHNDIMRYGFYKSYKKIIYIRKVSDMVVTEI